MAGRPARLELLDQLGGGDDLGAEAAHEFDGAGVDHGDIGDGAQGRVLHGDALRAAQQRPQASSVPASSSRRSFRRAAVEHARFDAVHQAARFARRRG